MSFDGNGIYSLPSPENPAVAGTTILASDFNITMDDIAAALTKCIAKDGQSTPTAAIPMGGQKITGLGTGVAATDATTLAQVQALVAAQSAGIPAGTVMAFYQASVPTGWTAVVPVTGATIRFVANGGGGGNGGTHTIDSPPATTHTHSITAHSHTVEAHLHTVGDTAITVANLPAHTHYVAGTITNEATLSATSQLLPQKLDHFDSSWNYVLHGTTNAATVGKSSSVGSGTTHTHTSASSTPATDSSLTITGAPSSTITAFAPKYMDFVVGQKN